MRGKRQEKKACVLPQCASFADLRSWSYTCTGSSYPHGSSVGLAIVLIPCLWFGQVVTKASFTTWKGSRGSFLWNRLPSFFSDRKTHAGSPCVRVRRPSYDVSVFSSSSQRTAPYTREQSTERGSRKRVLPYTRHTRRSAVAFVSAGAVVVILLSLYFFTPSFQFSLPLLAASYAICSMLT